MEDEESTTNRIGIIHISVGSATNGVHISTDVSASDKNAVNEMVDYCTDLAIRSAIARKQKDPFVK